MHDSAGWAVNIGASSIDAIVVDNRFGNNTSGDVTDAGTTSIIKHNRDWLSATIESSELNVAGGLGDSNVSAVDDSTPAAVNLKQSCLALQVGAVQTAEASANTNTIFDTDLPLENDDYYGSTVGGLVIAFVSGEAQQFQTRRVVASSTGTLNTRITLEESLDGVPSDADVFVVLGRITELT